MHALTVSNFVPYLVLPHMLDFHVKKVNTLLNNGKTRENGLKLLLSLVQQCPQKILAVQGDRWFVFCTQTIKSVWGTRAKKDACQIISSILRDLPSVPELQRIILSKSVGPLLVSLATADSLWDCAALECLYEYMKLAPGQCLAHKTVLEEHILGYLDGSLTRVGQRDAISEAGRVFAALPLPGMGGSGFQGRAEARGRQLTQLVAVCHDLMDYLFDGILEKESYDHTRKYNLRLTPLLTLGEGNTDTLRTHLAAVTRLVNSMKFIGELITADVNEAVTVVPRELLSVVFRCLQVDQLVLTKYRSREHKLLAFFMPSLHQHSLLLIRDILFSIGESVDMYFGVIAELLLCTIKGSMLHYQPEWCTSGQQTRIIAYSVMSNVIQVSGGRHTPSCQLVKLILEDVVPKGHQVRLQMIDKGLSSLSLHKKKSKKKGYAVTVADSLGQIRPLPRLEYFSRTTRVALSLIETLFTYASHSMMQKTKQSLLSSVLAVAATVTGVTQPPVTYVDGRTRAQLFKTVASMAIHPHPGCEPPYTIILHYLHAGLHDSDMLVVSACQMALGSVSFIMANPQVCSLMYNQHHQLNLTNGEEEGDEMIKATHEEVSQSLSGSEEEEDMEGTLRLEEEEEEDAEAVDDLVEEAEQKMETEENGEEEEVEEDEKEKEEVKRVEDEKQKELSESSEKVEEQDDMKGKTNLGEEECDAGVSTRYASQESLVLSGKRTADENPISHKKSKKTESEASVVGPTLDEMLASFVDCDPDN
ncbi:uncharacterized protein LOC121875104 isoform X2 [Homarus americanus]|uniref:uncharacterized protein LOC121875104 isoform X2 n=1 Tax=Homarus americanus TaxID=6706 RepID=UPI001C465513|nr:uncharacterized protein LOC121875104 isoform X2 [Homarus americanus]